MPGPSGPPAPGSPRELVLVGAGHAHVQVLRSFAMEPPPATRVTLIVDTPIAVYSGMVPGVVGGRYRPEELEIDAVPLARRAGARVVLAPALAVDPAARRIAVAGRPPVAYDLASIDVGSRLAGLELPGVAEHTLPTRPIGRLLGRVEALVAHARATAGPFRLVVVGGGAGGVELAAAFRARLAGRPGLEVTLVHAGERLLPGSPEAFARRAERELAARGIRMVFGRQAVAATAEDLVLDDGARLPCEGLVWVTGAVGPALLAASRLPLDDRGFVRVRRTLQVEGYDDLFAVGDCATLTDFPATPKAGVYAVRQGPYLTANLRAALAGRPLRPYRPQRDFLALLNLGDGMALGGKWGRRFAGRWVMELKDRIDRRFMDRFQLLAADGGEGPAQATLPRMGEGGEMVCGGCAAKLGEAALTRALARLEPAPPAPEVVLGLAEADDAVAFRTPGGEVVVASVDAFRAFTDDPFLVGRAAAVNSVSDLQAKGVEPRWAQAIVALPLAEGEAEAEETLVQVLAGARAALDPIGVRLLGGHTSRAAELSVGFAVQGVAASAEALLRRRGALAPGQVLILTRPLGTGVLFHADMAGRARGPWLEAALAGLAAGNGPAASVAAAAGATAATDVTGFGLAGHLATLLAGSGLAARLRLADLPALPGAVELLARGERSTFHDENARRRRTLAVAPEARRDPRLELLFDPQTAGGLLFTVAAEAAEPTLARLVEAGCTEAAAIGEITEGRADGAVAEVVLTDVASEAGKRAG